MFDHGQNIQSVDVFVTLTDGRELFGSLVCGLKADVSMALNGEGQFIELKDHDGDATFIGKHQVATLEKAKGGNRKQSTLETASKTQTNWQDVLGVSSGSDAAQVKAAYHTLAKQYHPDMYPAHLPQEMRQYANDRFMQINKAYEAFLAVAA
ncbi:MAG: J domain-containing protein [Rhizobiaceae bacterium]|nr:J domain-containing protein [Rhizobiaceae bacterium]